MAYCICRINKLKSGGAITASEQHTLRTRETPNADLSQNNKRLMGSPMGHGIALEQEVFDRIGDQTIRKDGVLCVEILLTASPEYFRPSDPSQAGRWENEQLDEWKTLNKDWLDQNYGDRIVRAELHLDESTPHIHAYFVPLNDKGKLSCKSHFGGRGKLRALQDSYAEAMKPLGLERGIKGSRATHIEVKDYYAAVRKESMAELIPQEIEHQLADRRFVLLKNDALERTAKSLSRDNDRLQQRVQDLEQKLQTTQQTSRQWQERYQATVNQLREVPLTDVAHELGLDPDPRDGHKWRDESLVVNITGSKFYDFKAMSGGGGAIDLVMHVNQCRFGEAVTWLRDRFGEGEVLETLNRQAREIVQSQPVQSFIAPPVHEEHWEGVKGYLTKTRMLPRKMVDQLHRQGLVYADERQNAVFVRRSLSGEVVGASLRGTVGENNQFKGLAAGTRRSQGWFYTQSQAEGPIERVVLCESAIDALSYQVKDEAAESRTLYLSTDGAGYVPKEWLGSIPEVVVAFDHDEAGDLMAQQVMRDISQAVREKPQQKDWNMDLQMEVQQIQERFERMQNIQNMGYGRSGPSL